MTRVSETFTDQRFTILDEATRAIVERGKMYGPPEVHFARTVGAINAILRHKLSEDLTPADWAACMVIDKLARNQQVPQLDNAVDICGYASCMGAVQIPEVK